MNWLARIPGGSHEIRRQKGPGDGFAALLAGGNRHVFAHRADGVGPFEQLAGIEVGQEAGQEGIACEFNDLRLGEPDGLGRRREPTEATGERSPEVRHDTSARIGSG